MRTVGVRFVADVSNYMSGVKRASTATADFTRGVDGAAKAGHLDKVADQAVRFGAVGAIAFGAVVKSAADFDKQMSAVSAATHASSSDLGKLRAAALQAGKDTQFSATQAADGITQLSKAGVSTANILGGGLKGALDLAAAGQMDVGEAAEVASSAMTQFKLSGDKVPHLADLLAAGAGKAQGSVHDLSMALNMGGLVAAQMGLSIEDTTGTLAAFANAGLMGSDAGTSMKTMFLALANPSAKAAETMQDLGIQTYDASGKFVGITKLAGQLHDKLGNLTQQQRNAALATIFGSDAIRSASILYEQGASGIQGWIDKVNDAGYASETASKLTDNLSGDIERLKGSLETLAIQSGSGSNSGLRVLAKGLNGVVNQFLGMPPAVGATITVMAGVGAALALSLAAFIKLRKGMAEAVLQLNEMGPAGEKAAAGLQKTASAAAEAAGAFIALEGLATLVNSFGRAAANVDGLTASLTNLANTGKVAGEAADKFGADLSGINMDAAIATSGVIKWIDKVEGAVPILGDAMKASTALGARLAGKDDYATAVQNFTNLDQALVSFMTTTNDVRKSGDLWNQVLLKSGLETDQLAKLMPGAWAQLQKMQAEAHGAAGATQGAATATGNLGTAASGAKEKLTPFTAAQKAVTEAAKGQRTALKDLSSALEAQFNPVQALINAQKDFKTKQDAAKEAVHKYGSKSREARAASLELAGAALNLTGKVGDLGGSFDGKLSPAMRTALRNAGLTKGQIHDVEGAFKTAKTAGDKFSKKYQADVSIKNDKGVGHALGQLSLMQQYLKTGGRPPSPLRRAFEFAGGGWTGPGSRNTPAGIVHADEYVISKPARRRLESSRPGALDSMNSTGRWPGYAAGGLVGWPFPATAAMTRIPSRGEAMAAVGPPGGQTYRWIERMVRAAFPGMRVLSDFRPGARTLSGNVSYHALGRAVDFPPSRPLAEWFNVKFKSRIKELITPYQDLNLLNGARHTYTGAIWNQHNFAGGNAHDHVAMDGFGVGGGSGWMPSGGGGGGGGVTVVLENHGVIGSQAELDNWLASGVDRLKRRGRI